MSYAVTADILEQLAEADLISLTDDSSTGLVDEAVVARAIGNAEAVIDAHCQGSYTLPFMPVPVLVRLFSVDIAIYNLYSRRPHVDIPESVKDRQAQALAYLKRVQAGTAAMGSDAVQTATEAVSGSSLETRNERLFTRTKMGGW